MSGSSGVTEERGERYGLPPGGDWASWQAGRQWARQHGVLRHPALVLLVAAAGFRDGERAAGSAAGDLVGGVVVTADSAVPPTTDSERERWGVKPDAEADEQLAADLIAITEAEREALRNGALFIGASNPKGYPAVDRLAGEILHVANKRASS